MSKRGKAKNLGPWFRTYASILDNPKIARLPDALFRLWMSMMALATIYGGLIPLDLNDVAFRLRRPVAKVRAAVHGLLSANLMEQTTDGYVIHDWEEMQFGSDVSTGRVKQFRERKRNADETHVKRSNGVSRTVSETAPDTEADTESEAEYDNQPSSLTAARASDSVPALAASASGQSPIPPIGSAEEAEAWDKFQANSVVTLHGRPTSKGANR